MAAIGFVALSGAFIIAALVNQARDHLWFGLALMSLVMAYFIVLGQNFTSRSPIQTRGGVVDPSTSPIFYFAAYGLMALFGVIAAIVFLAALVLPNL
jgi:hypothetical protein